MTLSPKQKEFVAAFRTKQYQFMLYGGGVAGGKTILVLGLLDELCQKYPGTRYAVLRKSLTAIRRNTIPSFRKILLLNGDPLRAELNKSEWSYLYKNGSEVIFVEANTGTDPELNKIRGLEVTGAVLEEANEMDEEVFEVMITRKGRWMNLETGIPGFLLLTCNPSHTWVKSKFYDKSIECALHAPFYFLQALPTDNPFNPKEYLDSLEHLSESEYQVYVKGNWEFATNNRQLIQFLWLKEVIRNETDDIAERKPRYIAVDVAREGTDKTVICLGDDLGILSFEEISFARSYETSDRVEQLMKEYNIVQEHVGVDGIGIGAGVIDDLERKKIFITVFKSSNTPSEAAISPMPNFVFYNKRAEAHWLFREDIRLGNIDTPNHKEFLKECLIPNYIPAERCIKIEIKDEIKQRLGKSPDFFEAAIIFNYIRHMNLANKMSFVGLVGKTKANDNWYRHAVGNTLASDYLLAHKSFSIRSYVGAYNEY